MSSAVGAGGFLKRREDAAARGRDRRNQTRENAAEEHQTNGKGHYSAIDVNSFHTAHVLSRAHQPANNHLRQHQDGSATLGSQPEALPTKFTHQTQSTPPQPSLDHNHP